MIQQGLSFLPALHLSEGHRDLLRRQDVMSGRCVFLVFFLSSVLCCAVIFFCVAVLWFSFLFGVFYVLFIYLFL